MDNIEKVLNGGSVVLVVVGLIVAALAVYKQVYPTQYFEVGDCAAYVYEAGEFTPREVAKSFHRIEKVGSESYLTTEWNNYTETIAERSYLFGEYREFSFYYLDSDYVKVDCVTGEEL